MVHREQCEGHVHANFEKGGFILNVYNIILVRLAPSVHSIIASSIELVKAAGFNMDLTNISAQSFK